MAAGCAPHLQPIFDETGPVLCWPPEPEAARIRYVGMLRSAEDLKPGRSALARLGDLFAGPPEPRPLYGPRSVVRTRDGSALWVADPGGRCVHVLNLVDRSYRKITRAGGDPLLSPVDVCLGPADHIFVCDSEGVAIHEFAAKHAAYVRTLRLGEDFGRPAAIAYSTAAERLFVVDVAKHDIKVLGPDDRLTRIIGRRGRAPGAFNFPCDVVIDGDDLWVADTGNQRIQRLALDGTPVSAFGSAGDAPGDLAMPKSIALDADGHVYVVDARFENVQIFDREGRLLLVFGDEGTGPGEFWLPGGIFIDGENGVWVCDSYNARVQGFVYTTGIEGLRD
ncbi:MAG TPA: 6-bladed beta-propeller [Phycisphaerae bacterium]|nr:hypothetical protein [Phycisphaerales bacterium]HRX85746.1 6-bladed beta-propeller [Phycisphaerae bacterium]